MQQIFLPSNANHITLNTSKICLYQIKWTTIQNRQIHSNRKRIKVISIVWSNTEKKLSSIVDMLYFGPLSISKTFYVDKTTNQKTLINEYRILFLYENLIDLLLMILSAICSVCSDMVRRRVWDFWSEWKTYELKNNFRFLFIFFYNLLIFLSNNLKCDMDFWAAVMVNSNFSLHFIKCILDNDEHWPHSKLQGINIYLFYSLFLNKFNIAFIKITFSCIRSNRLFCLFKIPCYIRFFVSFFDFNSSWWFLLVCVCRELLTVNTFGQNLHW